MNKIDKIYCNRCALHPDQCKCSDPHIITQWAKPEPLHPSDTAWKQFQVDPVMQDASNEEAFLEGWNAALEWAATNAKILINGEQFELYHINDGFVDAPVSVSVDSILNGKSD